MGDDMPNCPTNLVIDPHALSLLFLHLINTSLHLSDYANHSMENLLAAIYDAINCKEKLCGYILEIFMLTRVYIATSQAVKQSLDQSISSYFHL